VVNLNDREKFGFVERQHVFSGRWATLREK
jgi:hypothetical protein